MYPYQDKKINQEISLYFDKVFLLYITFDCFKDKLSITTMVFIRSENNLALLQLYVFLGISECIFWIHSMLRVTCGLGEWLLVGIVWAKPLLCMCSGCWAESILRPGVLRRTLSHKSLRWYLPAFLFNDRLLTYQHFCLMTGC